MKKAIVLSSGGVDSTTCVGLAVDQYGKNNVSTVSIYYGQKHSKELRCAEKIADYYDVPHYELNLADIFTNSNCPLLRNSTESIPDKSYAEQIAENGKGFVKTYVPYRNGLMLSAVTSLAMSLYPDDDIVIYIGAHADDAAGDAYPDCSVEFVDAINKAIQIGTYNHCSIYAPFVNCTKPEVVKTGLKLDVPYNLTYSCYKGGDKACGTCGTCIDRRSAFEANGVVDPIEYEN